MFNLFSVVSWGATLPAGGNCSAPAPFFHFIRVFAWEATKPQYGGVARKLLFLQTSSLQSKKCVSRRRNVVINSNELHCFTEEVGLEYVDIDLNCGLQLPMWEFIGSNDCYWQFMVALTMGILTSSNVLSVFTSLLVQANYVLLLLSLQFLSLHTSNARYFIFSRGIWFNRNNQYTYIDVAGIATIHNNLLS